jgi:DNA polymerase III alpha subunit
LSLIQCGAFDKIGTTRKEMIQNYENILKKCQNKNGEAKGQLSLFESKSVNSYNEDNYIKLKNEVEEYDNNESTENNDCSSLGSR